MVGVAVGIGTTLISTRVGTVMVAGSSALYDMNFCNLGLGEGVTEALTLTEIKGLVVGGEEE